MDLRHRVHGVWALVMVVVASNDRLAADFVGAVSIVEDSARQCNEIGTSSLVAFHYGREVGSIARWEFYELYCSFRLTVALVS